MWTKLFLKRSIALPTSIPANNVSGMKNLVVSRSANPNGSFEKGKIPKVNNRVLKNNCENL